MPKNDFEKSETGNWNVASDYAKYKIMKWLAEADDMEMVATFGVYNFEDSFYLSQTAKAQARIKALYRLRKILEMIINNTRFAIKSNTDKDLLKRYSENLDLISKGIKNVEQVRRDRNKKIIEIKEEIFSKYLDILIDIKSGINQPLNNADLIFSHSEEFDPEAYKKAIKERFIGGE